MEIPILIEELPNEILVEIFKNLDGDAEDIITIRRTCHLFRDIIDQNENSITLAWARKQHGVLRILLENLRAHPCYRMRGVKWLQECASRELHISYCLDILDSFGFVSAYWEMARATHPLPQERRLTQEVDVHLRRQMSTFLLAAELMSLEPSWATRQRLLVSDRKKHLMLTIKPLTALSIQVLSKPYIYVDKCETLFQNSLVPGPDIGRGVHAILDILHGMAAKGTTFLNNVILRKQYKTTEDLYSELDRQERRLDPNLEADVIHTGLRRLATEGEMTKEERGFARAFNGVYSEWEKNIPTEVAWEQVMRDFSWSIPFQFN